MLVDRLACLEAGGSRLALRRAWPRGPDHVLLEFVDGEGAVVPGQWFADRAALRRIADETARRCPGRPPRVLEGEGVMLQPGGADRRLVGLASVLARPGAELVSHRPERRAVVRLDGGERYAKVVRPSRAADLAAATRGVRVRLEGLVAVAEEVELDTQRGVVVWSRLPGTSLDELLADTRRLAPAARAAGEALRHLHESGPSPGTAPHDAAAEIEMLTVQLRRLAALEPETRDRLGDAPRRVFDALAAGAGPRVPIHRDFYDKQVHVDDRGRAALLDFDTLSVGEPALDVGNALAHLELRVLQGRCPEPAAAAAAESFLDGYRPDPSVRVRVPAWEDATRLRLACLYAWRPAWRRLTSPLVARIGAARHSSSV